MEIKSLAHSSFEAIVDSFLSAFEGYFVKMPEDKEYYRKRWAAAKVDFDLSFGMYDQEQLVGFIIHAIDTRNGYMTAYNTGTGVIPNYRGQQITSKIYKSAIPLLKKQGVTRGLLEVITENHRAIKVYEDIGFKKIKHYRCFKGEVTAQKESAPLVQKCNVHILEEQLSWPESKYSWDNQIQSIQNSSFDYYQIHEAGTAESYFVIDSENGNFPQFDVYQNTAEAWKRLANAIHDKTSVVKSNNIDLRFKDKLACMAKLGIPAVVDQFEMEMMF